MLKIDCINEKNINFFIIMGVFKYNALFMLTISFTNSFYFILSLSSLGTNVNFTPITDSSPFKCSSFYENVHTEMYA